MLALYYIDNTYMIQSGKTQFESWLCWWWWGQAGSFELNLFLGKWRMGEGGLLKKSWNPIWQTLIKTYLKVGHCDIIRWWGDCGSDGRADVQWLEGFWGRHWTRNCSWFCAISVRVYLYAPCEVVTDTTVWMCVRIEKPVYKHFGQLNR